MPSQRDGAGLIPACDPTINAEYGYWATVRASVSHDGEWAVFDSNYALRYSEPDASCVQPLVKNYGDPYLVRTTVPPPPPRCGPCWISNCTGVELGCVFNNTCGPSGCCNYNCGVEDPTCTGPDPVPPNTCGGF